MRIGRGRAAVTGHNLPKCHFRGSGEKAGGRLKSRKPEDELHRVCRRPFAREGRRTRLTHAAVFRPKRGTAVFAYGNLTMNPHSLFEKWLFSPVLSFRSLAFGHSTSVVLEHHVLPACCEIRPFIRGKIRSEIVCCLSAAILSAGCGSHREKTTADIINSPGSPQEARILMRRLDAELAACPADPAARKNVRFRMATRLANAGLSRDEIELWLEGLSEKQNRRTLQ